MAVLRRPLWMILLDWHHGHLEVSSGCEFWFTWMLWDLRFAKVV